nr:hypothetical protein HmN_000567000 [Hymenolepis microstoma]
MMSQQQNRLGEISSARVLTSEELDKILMPPPPALHPLTRLRFEKEDKARIAAQRNHQPNSSSAQLHHQSTTNQSSQSSPFHWPNEDHLMTPSSIDTQQNGGMRDDFHQNVASFYDNVNSHPTPSNISNELSGSENIGQTWTAPQPMFPQDGQQLGSGTSSTCIEQIDWSSAPPPSKRLRHYLQGEEPSSSFNDCSGSQPNPPSYLQDNPTPTPSHIGSILRPKNYLSDSVL